jgi:hypothetical protein
MQGHFFNEATDANHIDIAQQFFSMPQDKEKPVDDMQRMNSQAVYQSQLGFNLLGAPKVDGENEAALQRANTL